MPYNKRARRGSKKVTTMAKLRRTPYLKPELKAFDYQLFSTVGGIIYKFLCCNLIPTGGINRDGRKISVVRVQANLTPVDANVGRIILLLDTAPANSDTGISTVTSAGLFGNLNTGGNGDYIMPSAQAIISKRLKIIHDYRASERSKAPLAITSAAGNVTTYGVAFNKAVKFETVYNNDTPSQNAIQGSITGISKNALYVYVGQDNAATVNDQNPPGLVGTVRLWYYDA